MIGSSTIVSLVLLLGGVLTPPASSTASYPVPPISRSTTQVENAEHAMVYRLYSGHMAVDVTIEGLGPWPFVIDTGANRTAIADVLARNFGYQGDNPYEAVQTLTTVSAGQLFDIHDVRLGMLHRDRLNTLVSPISPDSALMAYGLLGADMFEGRQIAIRFIEKYVDLDAQSPAHADALVDDRTGLVLATATVGRRSRPVHVLIDTGATQTIINPVMGQRLANENPTMRVSVGGFDRLQPENETRLVRLTNLQIGGLCDSALSAVEADLDIFRALGWENEPAMVLGLDLLQYADLVLDYRRGEVEISPGPGYRSCMRPRRVQRHPSGQLID